MNRTALRTSIPVRPLFVAVFCALVALQVSGCVTSEPTRPDLPSKTTISGSYGAGGSNVSKPNISSPEVDLLQARPPISREQAIDLALREARRRGIQVNDGKGEATLTQERGVFYWHVSYQEPPTADWIVKLHAVTGRVERFLDTLPKQR